VNRRRVTSRLVQTIGLAAALCVPARPSAAMPIPLLDFSAAGFVGQAQQGPLDQPVSVSNYAEFTATFGASTAGLANPYLAPSVAAFFANGGSLLWIVRTAGADDASLIGADGGPGARTGLQALIDVDGIGAVAIPGATSQAVQTAMIAHCEAMGDRIAILDPVSATDPNAVITQRAGLATTNGYGALYFPWIVASPAGVSQTLPPSGFVAGIYARTSPEHSPAGTTYGVVSTATDVSFAVSSTLQSTLNPLGIDAIRYFSGQGVLVFGARTLASDPEWQYVPVRRMAISLQQSIDDGTSWAVLEPNDENLWSQLRTDVSDFMFARFQEGWFQGTTANQAYFVKCDLTTMTQTDLEEGRTVILVGFAPLAPAEFVLLTIVQERSTPVAVTPSPPRLELRAPRPNPASGRAVIAFELPREQTVTLRVHDVAGRVVCTMAAGGRLAPGPHTFEWDGRDESGAAAPAGIYVVRLEAGGRALARRLALIR